jgi:hypothetical protein
LRYVRKAETEALHPVADHCEIEDAMRG